MHGFLLRSVTVVLALTLVHVTGCSGQTEVRSGILDLPDPSGSGNIEGAFESGEAPSSTQSRASEIEGEPTGGTSAASPEEGEAGNEPAREATVNLADAGSEEGTSLSDTTSSALTDTLESGPVPWVPEDTSSECEFYGCDGQCADYDDLGDGSCDSEFDCPDWAYDGGDCLATPEADASGSSVSDTSGGTWADDTTPCSEGYILDCYDECSWSGYLGDDNCDSAFDCDGFEGDYGDCVEAPVAVGSIIQVLGDNSDFFYLLEALDAADLTNTLAESGPFTLFAPTNAAFSSALSALGIGVDELFADLDLLTSILLYHLVQGVVSSNTLAMLTEATSLQGSPIVIDAWGGAVVLNNVANVGAELEASNGIVHVIDALLLPPSEPGSGSGVSCEDGYIVTCDGTDCKPSNWLGDNYCDSVLNCEQYDFDQGDCD